MATPNLKHSKGLVFLRHTCQLYPFNLDGPPACMGNVLYSCLSN